MRRLRIVPMVVLVSLTASACLTEDATCPPGHTKTRGLCVKVDDANRAGPMDSGTDADFGGDGCYLDRDHDGIGAGDEVDCDEPYAGLPDAGAEPTATDAASSARGLTPAPASPAVVHRRDDCDDNDPKRAPTLKELCDGLDNNCNGEVDENAKNACGGTCTRVLDHAPGEPCDNGQQGACARPGKYICQGDADVVCNASNITASSELCGDGIDNDCDSVSDEPDAVNASYWYQDCDGDGYAASTTGAVQSCTRPANAGSCGWTQVVPQATTRTNWDCNDGSAAYKPGADFGVPPAGQLSWDLNCDGVLSAKDPIIKGDAEESEDIFVCDSRVIARLNSTDSLTRQDCDPSDDRRSDGCILWKDSSGAYTDVPQTKCPDTQVFRLSVSNVTPVLDPWSFHVTAPPHATACARPSSHSRARRGSSSGRSEKPAAAKTTLGWQCSVSLYAKPTWPCR